MAEYFDRPRPAECSILGVPASVNYQVGSNGSVLFTRPSEGDDFEVCFPLTVIARIVDEAAI